MYTFKQLEDTYFLNISNHQELTQALNEFCNAEKIGAGIISGLGAVKEVTLRFFDPATKEYVDKTFTEQMEISNLVGTVSSKDGQVYLHLHITLGRADYTCLSGHLMTATIHGAGEIVIQKKQGVLHRKFDEETGLNLFDF